MTSLARRESAVAWDLRGAWATRAVVILLLDPAWTTIPRVVGRVERVSPTDATTDIDQVAAQGRITVPCVAIAAVRRPHFHEPADRDALAEPAAAPRDLSTLPGQTTLPGTGSTMSDNRHDSVSGSPQPDN
jgi:hypothetical protein